jgi:hypothetical protein
MGSSGTPRPRTGGSTAPGTATQGDSMSIWLLLLIIVLVVLLLGGFGYARR